MPYDIPYDIRGPPVFYTVFDQIFVPGDWSTFSWPALATTPQKIPNEYLNSLEAIGGYEGPNTFFHLLTPSHAVMLPLGK
jgi:hypothetical protein